VAHRQCADRRRAAETGLIGLIVSDTLDLLPGILREFADLIGLPATLRLVESYGGVRLYVPQRLAEDHPLALLIGASAARQLADVYGGEEHFDIPRAVAIARQVRNRRLREERDRGMSHRDLALKYGLTERQVRNILGEAVDDRQAELFGAFDN
jgi:uncharacterized protein (DUF433 family)